MNNTTYRWDDFKCRCSAISKIMAKSLANPCLTEKQAVRLAELEKKDKLTQAMSIELGELQVKQRNLGKVILSDSATGYLKEMYAWEVFGKMPVRKEMDIEYLEKGRLGEADSRTLISILDGVIYERNEERFSNDFLTGEPDIWHGNKIIDLKTSWDMPTFMNLIDFERDKGLDNGYKQQIQGYLDITDATEGEVAYCLVNMPDSIINDYKRRLFYRGEYISEESPDFLKKWIPLARSMAFDNVPINQKVYRIPVQPFSDFERQQIYDRVKVCREWLHKFDEQFQKLNK